MENSKVISSKMCCVEIIGNEEHYIDADLSIVCKDGKYGLLHSSKMDTGEKDARYESTFSLPVEYDNLFFIETKDEPYLVAVLEGKQGLYKLKGCKNGHVGEVVAEKLLPCLYDRIEAARKNNVLLLYSQGKIFCYCPSKERMLTVCEEIEEPRTEYLLCTKGDSLELWNTFNMKCMITLPAVNECCHAGTYEQGDVFHLRYRDGQADECVSQLLFCEYLGHEVRLSPKARGLTVFTKMGSDECRVVRVEMSWGDYYSPLSIDTVNEIAKEEKVFE